MLKYTILLGTGLLAVATVFGCGKRSEVNGKGPSETGRTDSSTAASTPDTSDAGSNAQAKGKAGRPSPGDSLTEAQRKRLGPSLRRLLSGDTTRARELGRRIPEPAGTRSGKEVYSVMIQGVGREALREAGIPNVSEVGNVVTARLTADQIRRAAAVEGVRRIRAPGRAELQ